MMVKHGRLAHFPRPIWKMTTAPIVERGSMRYVMACAILSVCTSHCFADGFKLIDIICDVNLVSRHPERKLAATSARLCDSSVAFESLVSTANTIEDHASNAFLPFNRLAPCLSPYGPCQNVLVVLIHHKRASLLDLVLSMTLMLFVMVMPSFSYGRRGKYRHAPYKKTTTQHSSHSGRY